MGLHDVIDVLGTAFELAGAGAMVLGALVSLWLVARQPDRRGVALYDSYRRSLGRAILLGLEFLVAADILRTVTEHPTLDNVVILLGIVLIRTLLSFSLQVELEGRWPWQRAR